MGALQSLIDKISMPDAINKAHPIRLKVSFSLKKNAVSKIDIGIDAYRTALTAAGSPLV